MQKTLTGKVAFVTGSGRGLGRAIAERLAMRGADVVLHDISEEAPAEFAEADSLSDVARKLGGEHGVRCVAVTGDIGDERAVASMVSEADAALGPADVLVNCAGGDIAAKGGKPKPNDALNVPVEDIRALLDRNLVGTMLVCRAVCPGMVARRSGSVVHIASAAAHVGVGDGVVYAVAKAGLVQWSRCLAKELRPHGVRVNVISPGATMTARFLATRVTDPKMRDPDVPLERYALPDELGDAVAFFASDDSRFVSGQVLRVDGGQQLFAA
jgi:3-oxoacyl-[acyl-carrier protein] reductase